MTENSNPDDSIENSDAIIEEHPLLVAIRTGVVDAGGLSISDANGMVTIHVENGEKIVAICDFLRHRRDVPYEMLTDVVGVDHWDVEPRFGVVYILRSLGANQHLYLETRVPSDHPVLPSITAVWQGANWMEREVFDMFGVCFSGHPDLRKILTPDDLEGNPLRKDFPLGNVDVWPEGADTIVAR